MDAAGDALAPLGALEVPGQPVTFSRYLAGVVWLALGFVPIALAAVRLRRRYLPDWRGASARLAELTIAVGSTIVVTEALGTISAFRRWYVAGALATVGVIAAALCRPTTRRAPEVDDRPHRGSPYLLVAAFLMASVVLALWSVELFATLDKGFVDTDSQSYHLPHAARFVQEGSLTGLHHPTVDDAVPYHPANGEIFHAIGMLALGTDVLSPFINLVWLVVALLGSWVLGERFGQAPLAMIGAAAALATPIMSTTQGGSAMTDIIAIAMLVSAGAFLVCADHGPAPVALGGIAAGVALGTKLTMVVPVGALTIAVLIAARWEGYRRLRFAALWTVPMFLTGVFWYVRNIAHVGSPIPSMRLGIGPISFPKVPMFLVDRYGYSVADYALDGDVWRRYFLPGLVDGLGAAWPVLLLLCGAGLMLTLIATRSAFAKAVAAASTVSTLAYVITPTTALGFKGQPALFTGNLRYLIPPLLIGLVLAPTTPLMINAFGWRMLFGAGCLSLIVSCLRIDWLGYERRAVAFGAFVLLVVAGITRFRALPRPVTAIVVGVTVLTAVSGFLVSGRYVENRYAYRDGAAAGSRDATAFRWAQGVRRAKIGIVGFFVNYPLYGADLSNDVSYIGAFRSNNEFTNITACEQWRSALNHGRYDYVVAMPPFPNYPPPEAAAWTRSDEAVLEIRRSGDTSVFKIGGELDPATCPRDDVPTKRNDGSRRVDPGTEP